LKQTVSNINKYIQQPNQTKPNQTMGRDKGKFNKRGGRGGGSRFQATSAEEIEQRNSRIAEFDEKRAERRAENSDDEADGADAEVEKAGKGVAALNVGENPNRAAEEKPLTRKQREEADRERKAAEYRRRHELGLTDEYKRDMAALLKVKKRREDAAAKAAMENEAAESIEEERKAQAQKAIQEAAASDSDNEEEDTKKKKKKSKKKVEIPKLDKISVKKMKPAQLKEALKVRGCDIQGNAKTLTARLLEFEAKR